MITKRQKQILDYIKKFIDKNDVAPTLEEIKRHFRLASVSTIHQHIETLKTKGYLSKSENQPRTIDVLARKTTMEIPLLGAIAAGQPIEAIETPDETVTITENQLGKFGKYYALRVQGNSMIDEGIFDGDIVVIREQKTAENGQTVVAVIDDNEATLKKLYREKHRFRLQPANPSLFPIYRKDIEIKGVVAKIIRNLESPVMARSITDDSGLKKRVDYSWDFKGEKTKTYTHGFHTYPAMFIPQIAKRLLQTYSQKNDTICDIFCGSGTALVESRLLSRNSYGIDLNPLAIFLAKSKTTLINPSIITKKYFVLLNRIKEAKNNKIQKPNFLNLEFWFKDQVITQLAEIKNAINRFKNKQIRNFFLVAFSETARLVSNTRNGEFKLFRMPEDKLKTYNPNVLAVFQKKQRQTFKA